MRKSTEPLSQTGAGTLRPLEPGWCLRPPSLITKEALAFPVSLFPCSALPPPIPQLSGSLPTWASFLS